MKNVILNLFIIISFLPNSFQNICLRKSAYQDRKTLFYTNNLIVPLGYGITCWLNKISINLYIFFLFEAPTCSAPVLYPNSRIIYPPNWMTSRFKYGDVVAYMCAVGDQVGDSSSTCNKGVWTSRKYQCVGEEKVNRHFRIHLIISVTRGKFLWKLALIAFEDTLLKWNTEQKVAVHKIHIPTCLAIKYAIDAAQVPRQLSSVTTIFGAFLTWKLNKLKIP